SWTWCKILRHTPRTIEPCRRTRAANASPSCSSTKRDSKMTSSVASTTETRSLRTTPFSLWLMPPPPSDTGATGPDCYANWGKTWTGCFTTPSLPCSEDDYPLLDWHAEGRGLWHAAASGREGVRRRCEDGVRFGRWSDGRMRENEEIVPGFPTRERVG